MNEAKEYSLEILLKSNDWKDVFSESYRIAMRDKFVQNPNPREHGFKNHVHSFVVQLKKNTSPIIKQSFNKWDIRVVSYEMNIGSEINGDRPSIVYKASDSTKWEDIVVIPLTSAAKQQQSDRFDISVPKDDTNKLYQSSYARLRQIRSVSIKRVGKIVWIVTDEKVKKEINEAIQTMLAIND